MSLRSDLGGHFRLSLAPTPAENSAEPAQLTEICTQTTGQYSRPHPQLLAPNPRPLAVASGRSAGGLVDQTGQQPHPKPSDTSVRDDFPQRLH